MAIEAVVDSSAFLAHAFGEAGASVAEAVFPMSAISTVNLTEIVTSMIERSWETDRIRAALEASAAKVVDHDAELAVDAAILRRATRHRGLSLGDRACLALARRLRVPVYTADRSWGDLDVGVDIRVVR